MSTHLFGIRHHGPGCARSLRLALEALNPDIVLIEGPPDAQEVLPLMRHKAMTPPVALLIYAPDTPVQSGLLSLRALLAGVAGARLCLQAQVARALHRPAAGDPARARAGGS